MHALSKWLVALDLTEHDHSILKYTKQLADLFKPEHIEFVFIAQRLPDAVHVHLPESLKYPAYDELFDQLKSEVYEYFEESDPLSCEILDGPVQFDLWNETYTKDIDLFIAGSKPDHKGRGLFPKKFIRKSFCSVLFIPLSIPEQIERIWVPTDFSDQSGEALSFALQIANTSKQNIEVVVQHVYQLPHAYYYEGFPRQEILEAIRKDAEVGLTNFFKLHNEKHTPIKTCLTELSGSYAAHDINVQAEENLANLIVMASGGRSRFSRYFLGSETEQMVQLKLEVPLLILKKKADHVKLWDLYSVNS